MAHRLRDESAWTIFFTDAGIPLPEAEMYAKTFIENRLTEVGLVDLSSEHLTSLNITVLGDRLAILRHGKSFSQLVSPTMQNALVETHAFKPAAATAKLPPVTSDMTHPQFRKFLIDWGVYKKMISLPVIHVPTHLYSACDSEVQNSLINSESDFFNLSENEMLTVIESIVTKSVNPTVHRMNFRNLHQDENESMHC